MADGKKQYWYLRVKQDFYKSDELVILQSMEDGYLYSDILMKMYLASLEDEGRLMFRGMIPYSPEMLATITRHQVGVVKEALRNFQKLGLIEILDDGAIYMTDIQNFIGRSSEEADRKRNYRARIEAEKQLPVAEVPPVLLDEKPAEQIEIAPEPKKTGYSKEFEELWESYPRKKEKAGAYEKYKARLKDGFSHEELLTATKAYAEECRKDRREQQYIKQAKTFFGPATPFLDYLQKEQPKHQEEETDGDENPFRRP